MIGNDYEFAIEINNLCKQYKDFSLKNVSFNIPKGTVMGFVGQNGAGKSTTIKAILDLIKINSGDVNVFGLNAHNNAKLIKEHIGVVFDELGIPDTLNCKMLNNVMKNIYKNWNEDVFYNYIKLFSLPKDKIFKNFSRGMQMKVQTAVALSHNASLLVLDEATSGLDPIARNELLDILLEFMEDENHSILMSSHITSDLERIADYITFIDNGSLLLSDEKYIIQEGHALAKGSKDDIQNIPNDYVISIRNNSYGSEALITQPEVVKKLYPNYVYDKISLDDILCFYANRS